MLSFVVGIWGFHVPIVFLFFQFRYCLRMTKGLGSVNRSSGTIARSESPYWRIVLWCSWSLTSSALGTWHLISLEVICPGIWYLVSQVRVLGRWFSLFWAFSSEQNRILIKLQHWEISLMESEGETGLEDWLVMTSNYQLKRWGEILASPRSVTTLNNFNGMRISAWGQKLWTAKM